MPVVSQQIVINLVEGNLRYVVYEYTDHLGNKYQRFKKRVPVGFDVGADIVALVPQVDSELAEDEGARVIQRVEGGEDPETLVLNPDHATSKQIAKKLIRWMMRERDPYIVILLEPLIVYLRANYTAAQLKTFLDLTTEQATKLNTRIDSILDNKTALQAAESNMEDIE